MLSREDFVFTIGYDGAAAIVDAKAKKQYGKLGTIALAEAGLFRAAFASALYALNSSGSDADLRAFLDYYNSKAGTAYTTAEELKRLFGVVEENANRAVAL